MPKQDKPISEFDIGVDYETLRDIADHLTREHGLERCEAIDTLRKMLGTGVDNRVARNPDDINDSYTTYVKTVRKK